MNRRRRVSFGYWTTDFLVVQRLLTARDLSAAKLPPIIGAGFRMLVPFIVILPGLPELGIVALIAGFMPGMAGNMSAFATVWTWDIYRPVIHKRATDAQCVARGRWRTVLGC